MEIIRDGKRIELTSEELLMAFLEQENAFDIQDIKNNMENYLDESEYETLNGNEDFIKNAAMILRKNQDKYDMNYENAIREAFDETKLKYLENAN